MLNSAIVKTRLPDAVSKLPHRAAHLCTSFAADRDGCGMTAWRIREAAAAATMLLGLGMLALGVWLTLAGDAAAGQSADGDKFQVASVRSSADYSVVNCFDETLDFVQKTVSSNCKGKSVTDEAVEEIRNRRINYVSSVLSRPPAFEVPGKRLASIGSGFFVAEDGSLLTNCHVFKDCQAVSVMSTGGEVVMASSIVWDLHKEFALILSDFNPAGVVSFAASFQPVVPNLVAVVGYPNQGIPRIKPLLTKGEIVPNRSTSSMPLVIIIKADVRPGNSGGPLLDKHGNVIGVIYAKIDTVSVYDETGFHIRNIGFALPMGTVLPFLDSHGVRYKTNQASRPISWDELLNNTKPYIARIGCWK